MDSEARPIPQTSAEGADEMLAASRALLGVVARSLVDALQEITLPQFRVLVILSSSGPLRMGAIATRMGAHPSTFTRTVDRLVAGRWVEREVSASSRRETIISLSPTGADLVRRVTMRRRDEIVRILDSLSPAERRSVRVALESFAAAAGEPSAGDLLVLGL